jgi:hypothetical protein
VRDVIRWLRRRREEEDVLPWRERHASSPRVIDQRDSIARANGRSCRDDSSANIKVEHSLAEDVTVGSPDAISRQPLMLSCRAR